MITIPIVATSGAQSTVSLAAPVVNQSGGRVPAFPAFPDATNTGLTGATTLWTGSTEFRTNGQVIVGQEIRTTDGVYIPASNVTFRNCKFVFIGAVNQSWTMIDNEGSGNTFESCEMDGANKAPRAISGDGTGVTIRWCNVHHTGNGAEILPGLVEENYFHDIFTPSGQDWHADGVQVPNNTSGLTVRHNTIILTGGETGCVNTATGGVSQVSNVLVEKNLLAGGSYCLYVGQGTNISVLNNHFSTQIFPNVGQYGIWYFGTSGFTHSGNVIHETGVSVD